MLGNYWARSAPATPAYKKEPQPQGVAALSQTTRPGFEPGQREPKSLVLPLHYRVKRGRPSSIIASHTRDDRLKRDPASCHADHHDAAVAYHGMVSTTRKRGLPWIMCAYASAARASGNVSIIGRTPVSRLKLNASSESRAVPDGQPAIDRPDSSATGATCIGSNAAPTISSLPRGAKPPITDDMARALGAVARITWAPPSFCNSAAASVLPASI